MAKKKKANESVSEHKWQPTDTSGHNLQCEVCRAEINIYEVGYKKVLKSKCGGEKGRVEVQTRNEEGSLCFFPTLKEALDHAKKDKTVWKVSFSLGEERVRLIRRDEKWVLEQIPDFGELVKKFKQKLRGVNIC
jgi:hypothetical protein